MNEGEEFDATWREANAYVYNYQTKRIEVLLGNVHFQPSVLTSLSLFA